MHTSATVCESTYFICSDFCKKMEIEIVSCESIQGNHTEHVAVVVTLKGCIPNATYRIT